MSQQEIITDRFFKAIEQLGHSQLSVRIGAIYSLERIAQDSIRDNLSVMEVLASFIHDRCNSLKEDDNLQDVQASITVLGRINTLATINSVDYVATQMPQISDNEKVDKILYLKHIDLRLQDRKMSFSTGDYRYFVFNFSCLEGVNFFRANLSDTFFYRSNLAKADLIKADFRRADLMEANLCEANISKTNFQGAKGLTIEQIQGAKNWKEAIYDEDFWKQLNSN